MEEEARRVLRNIILRLSGACQNAGELRRAISERAASLPLEVPEAVRPGVTLRLRRVTKQDG